MKKYRPDKNGLFVLRIIIAIVSVLLILVVKHYIPVDILVIIISTAVLTTAVFMIFIYFPLYFSSLSYESSETEIIKHSGVFIKTHQSVRYSQVQYTTVASTPFSQYTGFNFVIFFVYGGQLRLMFLNQKDALEILSRTNCSHIWRE